MNRATNTKKRKAYLRIRTLMLKKGITAGDIGRTLGVTRQAVNGVIKGYWPSPRVQAAIAEALGVAYEKLWGKKEAA